MYMIWKIPQPLTSITGRSQTGYGQCNFTGDLIGAFCFHVVRYNHSIKDAITGDKMAERKGERLKSKIEGLTDPAVVAVSSSARHTFSKPNQRSIRLIEGIGVEGDAHSGKRVKHRTLVNQNPLKPNLRQVHLIQSELFDELNAKGFSVEPGQLGENITTRGVDLLALPTGTNLKLGAEAVIELTALRNPCRQIDDYQKGLMNAVADRDGERNIVRKAVMGIVLIGGIVRPGDSVIVNLPAEPHHRLEYVW